MFVPSACGFFLKKKINLREVEVEEEEEEGVPMRGYKQTNKLTNRKWNTQQQQKKNKKNFQFQTWI